MQNIWPMLALCLAAACLVIIVKALRNLSRRKGAKSFPYTRQPALLNPAERSFLGVLDQAVGDRYRLFAKVRLADVLRVQTGLDGGARQAAVNRLQSKHVDYVLCVPDDLSVHAVVELDDRSHAEPRRRERDEFVDQALRTAGVPVLHVPAQPGYTVSELRERLAALDHASRMAVLPLVSDSVGTEVKEDDPLARVDLTELRLEKEL